MASRDSSSSRDTVVHLSQKQGRTFPATPTKNEEGACTSLTTEGNDTTPPPTIRERRGRNNITNNGFRPLSVFTKSMLIPFDQNFEEAFEVLKGDSPDRLEIAKSILSPASESDSFEKSPELAGEDTNLHQEPLQKNSQVSLTGNDPQGQPQSRVRNKEAITPQRFISRSAMLRQDSLKDCDMDLMTALKVTSPEKDSIARVSGDFSTLCEFPVPDPSEHPAFASNSFEVKTEAPLLFTSTSVDAIRVLCLKKRRHENPPSNGKSSIERKKSMFGLGLSTPSSAKSRNAFRSSDDSSFPILISSSNTNSARSSIKNPSPTATDFTQPRESASIERSSGVRKISDIFRRKDSLEKSSPGSPVQWSPRISAESPNLDRQDLERFLRRTTYTPTFDFDPYSSYPRHPNTGRGWKSRNLKCTNCSAVDCAICHRVCCAYRAAVLALENHRDDSPSRLMALQRIQEITKLFPYGKETPTFLQCTAGLTSDMMGCGKMVCPDCCSICPDEVCADTVCRRCKPMMWEDCDWHKDGIMTIKS